MQINQYIWTDQRIQARKKQNFIHELPVSCFNQQHISGENSTSDSPNICNGALGGISTFRCRKPWKDMAAHMALNNAGQKSSSCTLLTVSDLFWGEALVYGNPLHFTSKKSREAKELDIIGSQGWYRGGHQDKVLMYFKIYISGIPLGQNIPRSTFSKIFFRHSHLHTCFVSFSFNSLSYSDLRPENVYCLGEA